MSERLSRLARNRNVVSDYEDLVVVVEDDDILREILDYLFKREGIRAKFAADGRTGLALIRRHRPKVVLVDVYLPHLSGLELVEDVRRDPRLNETLLVAVTAMAMDDAELQSLKGKADTILAKPLDEDFLMALIRAGFEHTGTRSSAAFRRSLQEI